MVDSRAARADRAIEPETAEAATILIRPGYEWMGHEPGQYLRIGVIIDGIHHWRAYSLTSGSGCRRRLHQHHLEARRGRQGLALLRPAGETGGDRPPRRHPELLSRVLEFAPDAIGTDRPHELRAGASRDAPRSVSVVAATLQ